MEREGLVSVKVWGEYACFTRPEFKVERVSYPVITPSAARGMLEAIFWKPEFRYEICEIGVLKLGSQTVILRNELDERQGTSPTVVEEHRQQRSSLVLKDVAYAIRAMMVLRSHATEPIPKYRDQFTRRVERGQCHHTPYLGTREFAAAFAPLDGEAPDPALNQDLGSMLFDVAFVPDSGRNELLIRNHGADGHTDVEGYAQALLFPARLEAGWLRVPRERYRDLRRLDGTDV